jgi:hypothetical protein
MKRVAQATTLPVGSPVYNEAKGEFDAIITKHMEGMKPRRTGARRPRKVA